MEMKGHASPGGSLGRHDPLSVTCQPLEDNASTRYADKDGRKEPVRDSSEDNTKEGAMDEEGRREGGKESPRNTPGTASARRPRLLLAGASMEGTLNSLKGRQEPNQHQLPTRGRKSGVWLSLK